MPEKPWWYLKKRVNPAGKLGRPPSSIPLAERRRLARQKYHAELTARGLCVVRLHMTTADAEKLRAKSAAQKLSPGIFVGKLLHA